MKSFFSQCAKLSLQINVAVVLLIIEGGDLLSSYLLRDLERGSISEAFGEMRTEVFIITHTASQF